MPTVFHRPAVLRHWPKTLPFDQDKAEVRILSIGMILFFAAHLLEPALYAFGVESSVLYKVVSLTGNPDRTLAVFFVCVALVVPHAVSLIFAPRFLHCRAPRILACAGAVFAAMLWFQLANLARPLDYGILAYIYAGRCLLDLIVAGILAFSLNSQQIRENAIVADK